MNVLIRDRLPRWYGISWREANPAILLSIHRDFLADFPKIKPDAPEVLARVQEFGFSLFDGSSQPYFGFDQCLTRQEGNGEFVEFVAPLPIVCKETDRPCQNCEGSGNDTLRDGKCLYCNGRGTEEEYTWRGAFAISASLNLFFRLACFPEKRTSAAAPQLLTVRLHTARGMHGGELGGMYGIPLAEWLRSQPLHTGIPEMVRAMKAAYGHMLGASRVNEYNEYSFRAAIDHQNGWLSVDCPGDACGLNPVRSPEPGRGYELSSHNVDTPAQQLTLLAGLAALCDRVRRDLA